MAQTFLTIRGIDPLLFRDGRPFTADAGGLTAQSLPLPLPTTLAAFVRSQAGNAASWDWASEQACRDAHGIPVHGPLLLRDGEALLPAPLDALLVEGQERPVRLAPRSTAPADCDLPDGMLPVLPETRVSGKPRAGFHYWPREDALAWLEGREPERLEPIHGLPEEERIGIAIDPGTRRAEEGLLYAVRLRAFAERTVATADSGKPEVRRHKYALAVRTKLPTDGVFLRQGTLGGERRLTVLEEVKDRDAAAIWPRCPETLKTALREATRVRMVLTTPAYFEAGWKPGWLDASGSGVEHLPAGISKVKLELVGAAVGRRVPVSGWSLRNNGPRPVRWLAPAGSVYFFKVTGGNPEALHEDAWMQPVSDGVQNRRDGLGVALWGTW